MPEMTDFQSQFSERPLAVGTVRGWRRFNLVATENGARLAGQYYGHWVNGVNKARCLGGVEYVLRARVGTTATVETRRIPACDEKDLTQCTCGYYAYWNALRAVGMPTRGWAADSGIVAVTEHWGETLIGELGMRSRMARILAVCVPDHLANSALRENQLEQMYEYYSDVQVYRAGLLSEMIRDWRVERPFDGDTG